MEHNSAAHRGFDVVPGIDMRIEEYVEEQGKGRPLVLVHGSYASHAAWKGITARLADHYRCISVALPGHAGTPNPGDFAQPSFEPEWEVLDKVIRARCDESPHVVGHSYGGAVVFSYAQQTTEAIRALTLFEPGAFWLLQDAGDLDGFASLDRVHRRLRRDLSEGVAFACREVIDYWGGTGSFDALPVAVQATMRDLERINLRHWDLCQAFASPAIDCGDRLGTLPSTLVYGDRSNPIAPAIVNRLREELPAGETVEIEGASHFLVVTHPDACAQAIRQSESRLG